MTWQKKVVWAEGAFLRPQQFQQQERYFEFYAHARTSPLRGYFWGFSEIDIDQDSLELGKVSILQARGILPDGTPFNIPSQTSAPEPLDVSANIKDQRIVLALPIKRHGSEEISFDASPESLARYQTVDAELDDINSVAGPPATIQLGELRLRLAPESELTDGWMALGVIRVIERRPDNQLILDKHYIPPTLSINNNAVLNGFAREMYGLLHQRGEVLAERLSAPGRGGVSEVADFLLLELVNRWEPLLKHFSEASMFHPELLYMHLLVLSGDLSTFTRETRRPESMPIYQHDDLEGCFRPLILDLRRSLSMVIEQNAIQITLEDRGHGVRAALMPSPDLIKNAMFVLAVRADVSPDVIQNHFPAQIKIGPVEKLRDLVTLHLPGVGVRALPIAPRQIPYHAGYFYFQLDTSHLLWKQLDRSGGLALHIAGDFPGLNLEFWAIRN
jgi:type VI secretion system protein ImpJ